MTRAYYDPGWTNVKTRKAAAERGLRVPRDAAARADVGLPDQEGDAGLGQPLLFGRAQPGLPAGEPPRARRLRPREGGAGRPAHAHPVAHAERAPHGPRVA